MDKLNKESIDLFFKLCKIETIVDGKNKLLKLYVPFSAFRGKKISIWSYSKLTDFYKRSDLSFELKDYEDKNIVKEISNIEKTITALEKVEITTSINNEYLLNAIKETYIKMLDEIELMEDYCNEKMRKKIVNTMNHVFNMHRREFELGLKFAEKKDVSKLKRRKI